MVKIRQPEEKHYVLQVDDIKKSTEILIFPEDFQRNALKCSRTFSLNGQNIDEDYLIIKNSPSSETIRVYSTDPAGSVAHRLKKYFMEKIDYFCAEMIVLDDILLKLFPNFDKESPKFTWMPTVLYFELKDVTFATKSIYWEINDLLNFFAPIVSFKVKNVTMDCNGRSDKLIKRDLLKNLERRAVPRVHLNRLIFDYETNDNTKLEYRLPIEYCEDKIFIMDADAVIKELEQWLSGKRKIDYWKVDVGSEREWKYLKEWINQKAVYKKKSRLGYVVTGSVRNSAQQWLHFKAKGGYFIASKNSFG